MTANPTQERNYLQILINKHGCLGIPETYDQENLVFNLQQYKTATPCKVKTLPIDSEI